MRRMNGVLAIVAGAIAGGLIALAVADGSSSHSSTTTTVYRSSAVPTSLSTSSHGMSVNQIYRTASPGVVDIVVTSTSNGGGNGLFGGGGQQQTQGDGAGVV